MSRDPLIVFERGRLTIRKKSPFLLAPTYGLVLTEVIDPEVLTAFTTPGMVMGYNPDYIKELSDEEGGFVLLHEVLHSRLKFFELLKIVGDAEHERLNIAHDLVINQMLAEMRWTVPSFAEMPAKRGFPKNLTTMEYFALLEDKSGGKGGSKGGPGKSSGKTSAGKSTGVCNGTCRAPSKKLEEQLDSELGRTKAEVQAIERKAAADIAKHIEGKGRGATPGWMSEWADLIANKPSAINWRDIIGRIVRDAAGRIISGGDDFSIRHPSKRSYTRRILRPGTIEREILPIFILDTSASMNLDMMRAGIAETVAILRQLGVSEAYYLEVDTAVALQPTLVSLDFFTNGKMEFHGRGGTDFRPAFEAIAKLNERPDIGFYWTDGDGTSPESPPPNMEFVWGLVPGRYSTRRPAKWGHLVVIDEDPTKQQFFEEALDVVDEDDD